MQRHKAGIPQQRVEIDRQSLFHNVTRAVELHLPSRAGDATEARAGGTIKNWLCCCRAADTGELDTDEPLQTRIVLFENACDTVWRHGASDCLDSAFRFSGAEHARRRIDAKDLAGFEFVCGGKYVDPGPHRCTVSRELGRDRLQAGQVVRYYQPGGLHRDFLLTRFLKDIPPT